LKSDYTFWDGQIPWYSSGELNADFTTEPKDKITDRGLSKSNAKVFPTGSLLIGMYDTAAMKMSILDRDAAFNQAIAGIKPSEHADLKFVKAMLEALKIDVLDQRRGTRQKNLSLQKIKSISVPLPPLEEQKRIVAVLDQAFAALDRARAHAEANLADAQQLVAAVTEHLFPNDDAMTSGRSLADLCEAIIDCEHKTAPTQDQGIPSIRTPNIGKGVLLLSGVNRVSEETYREWTRRAEPQPGDLILAREAPAGNVAVIPEGMRVCLGQRTVLLRPKKDLFVPAYLAHLLLRSSSQARLLAHSRGATVQHINVKDIRAFKVSSLPSLDEQGAVVRDIERLMAQGQALVSVYAGKLADIANLRQSLLKKAFSGELT
jgi:type I restriction enzyme S subunit